MIPDLVLETTVEGILAANGKYFPALHEIEVWVFGRVQWQADIFILPYRSRQGRSANGGTLTFRRTSTTASSQSLNQLQAAESIQSTSADPAVISAMPVGSTNVESLGAPRYSREQLLSIYAAHESNPQQLPDVSALFMHGWNPGHTNGSASRGWGKPGDSHVAPQEPDICWDTPGSTKAVGLQEMNTEEKEVGGIRNCRIWDSG